MEKNISHTRRATSAILAFGFALLFSAASARADVSLSGASALDDADMSHSRGGSVTTTTTVTANQSMESTSSGNSMSVFGNMANGPITVGENFGGSGFGSYVMNTGNNTVINSGVSLSVLMQQ